MGTADTGPGVGRPRAESALMGGPERPGPLLAQLYSGTVQRRRPWDQVAFTAPTARVGEAGASCEGVGEEGSAKRAESKRQARGERGWRWQWGAPGTSHNTGREQCLGFSSMLIFIN